MNYPIVEGGGGPAGVALTNTGVGFLDGIYPGPALPGVGQTATYSAGVQLLAESTRNADTTALAANKVAVTVVAGNYDVERVPDQIRRLVRALD